METLLVNAETGRGRRRGEDPSSERWIAYYKDARRRRRARGPQERTRAKLKRLRNRQLFGMLSGVFVVGMLATAFYLILG